MGNMYMLLGHASVAALGGVEPGNIDVLEVAAPICVSLRWLTFSAL